MLHFTPRCSMHNISLVLMSDSLPGLDLTLLLQLLAPNPSPSLHHTIVPEASPRLGICHM